MVRKKKVTAQSKRRMAVLGPICLIIIVYFLITFFSYTRELYHLKNEKQSLEEKYVQLQEEANQLKVDIVKLQDPEYLAKYARENYSYSKDGELIIKIAEDEQEKKKDQEDTTNYELIVLIAIIVIVLIFFYIILKGIKIKKKAKNKNKKIKF